jgi:hypothetical protein
MDNATRLNVRALKSMGGTMDEIIKKLEKSIWRTIGWNAICVFVHLVALYHILIRETLDHAPIVPAIVTGLLVAASALTYKQWKLGCWLAILVYGNSILGGINTGTYSVAFFFVLWCLLSNIWCLRTISLIRLVRADPGLINQES